MNHCNLQIWMVSDGAIQMLQNESPCCLLTLNFFSVFKSTIGKMDRFTDITTENLG